VMQRSQPHSESTTITGVYPCPVTGAFRLCYSGRFPVSLCGSEDHSSLRSRTGFSAQPTCSLERCSMTTIPRHCLVRFADYKQKDLAVNGKRKFCAELPCEALLGLRETPSCPSYIVYGNNHIRYCLYLFSFSFPAGTQYILHISKYFAIYQKY